MASTAHGTLTANQVEAVQNFDPGDEGFVVVNRSQEGELWVRFDDEDPEVGGEGSYVVIGARQFPMGAKERRRQNYGPLTVRLISDAARDYSIEAVR